MVETGWARGGVLLCAVGTVGCSSNLQGTTTIQCEITLTTSISKYYHIGQFRGDETAQLASISSLVFLVLKSQIAEDHINIFVGVLRDPNLLRYLADKKGKFLVCHDMLYLSTDQS